MFFARRRDEGFRRSAPAGMASTLTARHARRSGRSATPSPPCAPTWAIFFLVRRRRRRVVGARARPTSRCSSFRVRGDVRIHHRGPHHRGAPLSLGRPASRRFAVVGTSTGRRPVSKPRQSPPRRPSEKRREMLRRRRVTPRRRGGFDYEARRAGASRGHGLASIAQARARTSNLSARALRARRRVVAAAGPTPSRVPRKSPGHRPGVRPGRRARPDPTVVRSCSRHRRRARSVMSTWRQRIRGGVPTARRVARARFELVFLQRRASRSRPSGTRKARRVGGFARHHLARGSSALYAPHVGGDPRLRPRRARRAPPPIPPPAARLRRKHRSRPFTRFARPDTGEVLDRGVFLWFDAR